jgi:hypothetical protein
MINILADITVLRIGFPHDYKASFFNYVSRLAFGTSMLKNIAFFNHHFGSQGAKFSGLQIFPFGLGGPSISLLNLSFLHHLEIGQLLWTNT